MSFKMRVCLVLLALLLASATLSLGTKDPELRQCKHQCRAQQQFSREKREQCLQQCEDYYREKHGGGRGSSASDDDEEELPWKRESPIERLRECTRRCEQQQRGGEQRQQCQQRCQAEYERERERYEGGGDGRDEKPTDPQREYQECRRQCRHHGGEIQERCEERCEERRRERESEQRGRRGGDDPQREFQECRSQCRRQAQGGEAQELCERRCEERRREQEREQRGRGGGDDNPTDPQREFQECRSQCRSQAQGGEAQERCERRCEEGRREQEREQRGRRGGDDNPYVFKDRHFMTVMQTQHGRVRILQKFTNRSRLLKGIENYRVTILEAEPQTLIVPNHWDAEVLLFVVNGRGTLNQVRADSRESFNIRAGDIVRIRAGTTTYLVNRDNNERLVLAKLIQPVATPGEFEAFFGAGGKNPESFYRAFSDEILEAAFNVRKDRFQRLFGQQRQGVIIKASEEQIRAMSHREEGGIWPFGGESKGTINIYQQRPTHQNQYGQFYQVDSSHYGPLRDLDVDVTLANITQGAMLAPYYNSRSTKISIVVDGEGYFEMACPHRSKSQGQSQGGVQEHEERGSYPSYERVSSRLKRGTVVVIPAGHPFVAAASQNQNMQLLCFEINAENNERFPLAGRRNVMNQLESEAMELAFGVPAREVEEVFQSQEEEFFVRGPRQQQQQQGESESEGQGEGQGRAAE